MPLDPRMERAITDHLATAESLAWAFFIKAPGTGDLDEFKSIAAEALVRAAHRWVDPYCSSRGYWPWDPDDESKPEKHWPGYLIKTVKGALLDHARRQDHCTRSTLGKVKQVKAAQDEGIRGEDGLAAATGLSAAKVREVLTLDAARTVSIDAIPAEGFTSDYGASAAPLADHGAEADVEGQAAANAMMDVFLAAFDSLEPVQQVILALVYHREVTLEVAAKEVRLEPDEVRQLHDAAVCSVHGALLQSVSAEGTGSRTRTPAFRVSSADSCSAAERAGELKLCCGCRALLPETEFSWLKTGVRRMHLCRLCDRARQWARHAARAAAGVR